MFGARFAASIGFFLQRQSGQTQLSRQEALGTSQNGRHLAFCFLVSLWLHTIAQRQSVDQQMLKGPHVWIRFQCYSFTFSECAVCISQQRTACTPRRLLDQMQSCWLLHCIVDNGWVHFVRDTQHSPSSGLTASRTILNDSASRSAWATLIVQWCGSRKECPTLNFGQPTQISIGLWLFTYSNRMGDVWFNLLHWRIPVCVRMHTIYKTYFFSFLTKDNLRRV